MIYTFSFSHIDHPIPNTNLLLTSELNSPRFFFSSSSSHIEFNPDTRLQLGTLTRKLNQTMVQIQLWENEATEEERNEKKLENKEGEEEKDSVQKAEETLQGLEKTDSE